METMKQKQNTSFAALKDTFGYTNVMQAPRIEKVVISTGVGKIRPDKRKAELVAEQLAKIAGQKVSIRPAKKSIAAFKVRDGQLSGYQATLRGDRMFGFLDKLVNIALPRTRDFRGINSKMDEMGNYTLGIKENTIFPETADQDIRDMFGLAVTIVTSAKTADEAKAFFTHLGFPFKKEEPKKA